MFKDNFSRYEFKFPISYDDMDRIIDDLIPYVKADEYVNRYGIYTISSIYMDNDQLECYYETLNGDFFRQKVRLRVYGKINEDMSESFFELKSKIDGLVVKRRVKMRLGDAMAFMNDCMQNGDTCDTEKYRSSNGQILKEIKQVIIQKSLKPINVISYERMPFVALDDDRLRITFDFNLRSRDEDIDLTHGTAGEARCPKKVAILELKTNKNLPYWLVKILAKYNYRNQTFSKYCSHYSPMKILSDINLNDEGENKYVRPIYKGFN